MLASSEIAEVIYDHTNLNRIRELTKEMSLESSISESDLMNFWNLSPDMFAVASTDGKLLIINNAWTKILGWSKNEILNFSWFELIHPNDIKITKEVVGHITTNILSHFHNRYRKKSGGYITLEWNSTKWHNGKCYAVARPVPYICHQCPYEDRFKLPDKGIYEYD